MLLHRLPLEPSPLRTVLPEDAALDFEAIPRVPTARWAWALRLADLAFMVAMYTLAMLRAHPQGWLPLAGSAAAAVLVWLAAARLTGLYTPPALLAGIGHMARHFATLGLALAPAMIAALAAAPGAAALNTCLMLLNDALLFGLATRTLWQFCTMLALHRGGCVHRVAVLAETSAAARLFASTLERRTRGHMRSAACGVLPGLPGGATVGSLEAAIYAGRIDSIVVTGNTARPSATAAAMHYLHQAGLAVLHVPQAGRAADALPAPAFAQPAALALPASGDARETAKRLLDITASIIILAAAAPLLLLIATLIKLDSPGPVLFRQQRVGLHGNMFSMLKFRTMRADLQDDFCSRQTRQNDERVTRFGQFLRRTSLDELPQLINVLRNDMSLVGPRPHAHGMTVAGRAMAHLASGYAERHAMKPGITGWAQVNGCRGAVDDAGTLRRRVALDCYYIDNWSLRMDILILLRTISLVLRDRHAF